MRRFYFLLQGLIILAIILSVCAPMEKGSISGTVAQVPVWPPDTIFVSPSTVIWPPDTIFIALLRVDSDTDKRASTGPVPCWVPDTCAYQFLKVPYGHYKVVAMGGDRLFRMTKGVEGHQRPLSFYFANPAEIIDPADEQSATVLELTAENRVITGIDIKYAVPPPPPPAQ